LQHEEIAMDTGQYITYGGVGVITAIISGKWAMELGFRQSRQLLWMIVGLVVPPLALLALYVRQIRQFRQEAKPGGRW
jgi:hypothetical protein